MSPTLVPNTTLSSFPNVDFRTQSLVVFHERFLWYRRMQRMSRNKTHGRDIKDIHSSPMGISYYPIPMFSSHRYSIAVTPLQSPNKRASIDGSHRITPPIILLQTVIEEVRHRSLTLYNRLKTLTRLDDKNVWVFYMNTDRYFYLIYSPEKPLFSETKAKRQTIVTTEVCLHVRCADSIEIYPPRNP